jgi:hypothetical protein
MVNPFAETPEEKKELALHMYHNGHTYRDICKGVRLSPTTLSHIIKAELGSVNDDSEKLLHKPKESIALRLYNEGNKQPIEVAIELDITADEAIDYYQKYQQLKCLPLNDSCMKLKNEFQQLEIAKQNAYSQLNQLSNQVVEQNRALEYYRSQCEQQKNELFVLNYYANNLRAFLSNVQRRPTRY